LKIFLYWEIRGNRVKAMLREISENFSELKKHTNPQNQDTE
jgi:hypothetical protein